MKTLTAKQNELIKDNLTAYINNFGYINIEKADYGGGFYVYTDEQRAAEGSYTQFCDEINFRERMEWLDNPKSKAKITFFDKLCGFERTEYVKPYGFTQGYFDKSEIIRSLKNNGYVQIPFEWVYDPRQSNYKKFKGCYMQIVKQ